MKKLLTIILFLAGTYAFAQNVQRSGSASSGPSVRLHGYAIYAFDDNHVDSYYSATEYFDGSINGGFQYGGGLELMPFPGAGVEFTYLRLDSKAPIEYYNGGIQFTTFDIAQNWLFLSFNKYVPVNPKVEPYAGLELGMDIINVYNPDNSNDLSSTKFAWGIKAGVNIWANEKVGIELQTSLLSAVQAVGGGVYFGTGGAGAGVSGFSTYYQFNLGGGLVFKIR
jgi:opacity protein-like surface antigen